MSARSGIDSLSFARAGEHLSGSCALPDLSRLHDMLASTEGHVRWDLRGTQLAGRPALRLRLDGELALICQRCLERYVHVLHSESLIAIARSEDELCQWERDDPLLDGLVADANLDVPSLVEDEILLSLPAIPRHPEGMC